MHDVITKTLPADPAFPEAGLSGLPNGEFILGRAGMTLRDYFAAHATAEEVLAACVDLGSRHVTEADTPLKTAFHGCRSESERNVIGRLYFADLMLKARHTP